MTTILTNDGKYELHEYVDEDELEKIVIEHSKEIFGENTLYFNNKFLIESISKNGRLPDGYLIDLENEKFYVIEVELSSHPVRKHIREQIDDFRLALKNPDTHKKIIDRLRKEIMKNEMVYNKVKERIKEKKESLEVYDFLMNLISNNFNIIIIIDKITEELQDTCSILRDYGSNVQDIYFETYKKVDSNNLDEHIHRFSSLEVFSDLEETEKISTESLEDFLIQNPQLNDEDKKIILKLIKETENLGNNVRIDFSRNRISCKIGVKRFAVILHNKIHKRDFVDDNDKIEVFIFPVNGDSKQWVKDSPHEWSKYGSVWTKYFAFNSFEDIEYALNLIKQSFDEFLKSNSIELSSEMKCKKCGRISFKGEYCAVCRRLGYDKGRTTETKSKFFKKV